MPSKSFAAKTFKSTRFKSVGSKSKKSYDYEKIGRAKCVSHGAKGLYKDRNKDSCDTLTNAGCVWKTDDKGGYCDLPLDNSDMMEEYLSKDKSDRLATKAVGALRRSRSRGRSRGRDTRRRSRGRSRGRR